MVSREAWDQETHDVVFRQCESHQSKAHFEELALVGYEPTLRGYFVALLCYKMVVHVPYSFGKTLSHASHKW